MVIQRRIRLILTQNWLKLVLVKNLQKLIDLKIYLAQKSIKKKV